MSVEGHESRAIKLPLTWGASHMPEKWKCSRCAGSFSMGVLQCPKACPCCGVTFTQIQIGDVVSRV
jgi:Zn finger protein HypA/HybF involved in hydrogenase expression